MPALLVALLIVVPLLELYVLLQVGSLIGAVPTVLLLLAVSLLGAALLRREGLRAWRAFSAATASGRVPGREVADGVLVVLGGALLLTPGFVTDAVGLLLLLPPVRAGVRHGLTRYAGARLLGGIVPPPGRGAGGRGFGDRGPGRRGPGGHGPGDGRVIDGEVEDP